LDLYTLRQKGGDETKAFWFLKIADLRVLDYYNQEVILINSGMRHFSQN